MKKQIVAYSCLFLCVILPLTSQGAKCSAWFVCPSISDDIVKPLKVVSGKKITEIKLSEYISSESVRVYTEDIIRVVSEGKDPESGAAKQLVLAQAEIPKKVREAMIIMMPLPEPEGKPEGKSEGKSEGESEGESEGDLMFQTKVQDLADFKNGSQLFINLSNDAIRVKLGDIMVDVEPGSPKIYESPRRGEINKVSIKYEVFHPVQKKWRTFSASTVSIKPTRRKICIFENGSRPGNIKKYSMFFPMEEK